MENKRYCDEIDCAWCVDPNCPHDKNKNNELDIKKSFYKDITKDKEYFEGIDCSWFKDCVYYKQLESLKLKYEILTNKFFNSESDKTRLKQENEELKKKLQYSTTWEYLNKVNKYKQVLKEIREIAKDSCENSVCHFDCKSCSDGKIVDIIDEVLKWN
jgi:hypothetical protein